MTAPIQGQLGKLRISLISIFRNWYKIPTMLRLKRSPKKKKRRSIILRAQGEIYNLDEIYRELNGTYFGEELDLKITWFGRGNIPKTSVVFGSFVHPLDLIKVNRVLDRVDIPHYFVHFIVYHEMLHKIYPPQRGSRGRRDIHHKTFKEKEKEFPHFEEAKKFLNVWRERHFLTKNIFRKKN